jgi:NAD(P)-dependent dehydrogenase (short-subunit alcohol dehydrogenase family)
VSSRRLNGRVALVTGGSSGIGRAIALRFAAEGADVGILAVRPDPKEGGEPTAMAIERAGGRSVFLQGDVTDPASVDRAVTQLVDRFGGWHIVVCAAGVVPPVGDSREVQLDEFDRHMALNVRGTFLPVQRALRRFAAQGEGKIVTVASFFGLVGVPQLATYCASKAAVIGLTKALAAEFGEAGVNVNALCPGATKTAINAQFRDDDVMQEGWRGMTPLRMAGGDYIAEPSDIADAALFLASEESRFMTGACLVVDGGWIAQ